MDFTPRYRFNTSVFAVRRSSDWEAAERSRPRGSWLIKARRPAVPAARRCGHENGIIGELKKIQPSHR
jgi:hypothetical protein